MSTHSIAAMPALYIPPEVIDIIIAHVDPMWGTNTNTILSCSLVCRDWLHTSRHRLFEAIYINSKQYDLFVSAVLRSDVLRSWLASIHFFGLTERGYRDHHKLDKSPSLIREERNTHRVIHDIAGQLPNIRGLQLRNVDWIQLPPHPSVHLALSRSSSLSRLSLWKCQFPAFSTIRRTLLALPNLRDVSLVDVEWPSASYESSMLSNHPARPSLVTFSYNGSPDGCTTNLLTWLARTPTKDSIRSVEFHHHPCIDSHIAFLHSIARSLTTLIRPCLSDFRRLPISELVNLRILKLSLNRQNQWADLSSALGELQGPHLWRLVLDNLPIPDASRQEGGDGPSGFCLDDDGLESLDPLLQTANFRQLAVLRFIISAPSEHKPNAKEAIPGAIQHKLPKLHARGVIIVQFL